LAFGWNRATLRPRFADLSVAPLHPRTRVSRIVYFLYFLRNPSACSISRFRATKMDGKIVGLHRVKSRVRICTILSPFSRRSGNNNKRTNANARRHVGGATIFIRQQVSSVSAMLSLIIVLFLYEPGGTAIRRFTSFVSEGNKYFSNTAPISFATIYIFFLTERSFGPKSFCLKQDESLDDFKRGSKERIGSFIALLRADPRVVFNYISSRRNVN